MQEWKGEFGTVGLSFGTVRVYADNGQLWAWAHRPGSSWPCATLTDYTRVCAELDSRGDLVDLTVYDGPGLRDYCGDPDIMGDELTAWIDDNLACTPFEHLRRDRIAS